MKLTKFMSPSVMMNLESTRPMYEILIIQVRTTTPNIKIETKTIIIISAAVPATQELDTISTTTTMEATPTIPRATSRISPPMHK